MMKQLEQIKRQDVILVGMILRNWGPVQVGPHPGKYHRETIRLYIQGKLPISVFSGKDET